MASAAVVSLGGHIPPEHPMVPAARHFVRQFEAGQRSQLILPFDDSERTDWSYLPGNRPGIRIGDMTEAQRTSAFALLQTVLSQTGFEKTLGVIELEEVLKELEGSHRDPGRYWFTLFGDPDRSAPWGWRLEGHHLSLNFSSVGNELTAATPAFFGAHPAFVPHGLHKGRRVLGAEEDTARALVALLNNAQKRRAIISTQAPRDIITGRDRKARLSRMEGIPFADLEPNQRNLLLSLLRIYLDNMEPETARRSWEKIEQAGLAAIHFAWAGTIVPGQPHYYRIHGPTFVVEYDNTQNKANHVHSVWRDFEGDFGEDALQQHYREHRHDN